MFFGCWWQVQELWREWIRWLLSLSWHRRVQIHYGFPLLKPTRWRRSPQLWMIMSLPVIVYVQWWMPFKYLYMVAPCLFVSVLDLHFAHENDIPRSCVMLSMYRRDCNFVPFTNDITWSMSVSIVQCPIYLLLLCVEQVFQIDHDRVMNKGLKDSSRPRRQGTMRSCILQSNMERFWLVLVLLQQSVVFYLQLGMVTYSKPSVSWSSIGLIWVFEQIVIPV